MNDITKKNIYKKKQPSFYRAALIFLFVCLNETLEELIVIDDDLDAEDEEAFLAACEAAEDQLSSSAALVTDGNQFHQPDCSSVPEASPLESLPGFDVSAGKLWIYPTNYPVRDYQFNIVSQALKKNTLVTLPTGETFKNHYGRPRDLKRPGSGG